MRYRLKHGLHYCVAGPNVIFLDVSQSRYSALPPAAGIAFQRLAERGGLCLDEDAAALEGIIRGGLLAATDRAECVLPPVKVPLATDDLIGARRSFQLRYAALAAVWETNMALRLRTRSFSSVLASAGRLPPKTIVPASEVDRQIAAVSHAFDQTALLFGRTNRCLVRSLALFSILRSRGIAAHFVIGVRSQPFAAHAWVQHDGIVLNDSAEQVSCYTPILALP